VVTEIDELRAEVEQLKKDLLESNQRAARRSRAVLDSEAERTELRAEVERAAVYAREQEEGWRRATFENEQLRAEVDLLKAEAIGHFMEIDQLRAERERLTKAEGAFLAEVARLRAAQATALKRLRAAWSGLKSAMFEDDSMQAYALMAMDTLLGVSDSGEPLGEPTLWEP
jgi:chromosome segregation ATPase